MCNSAAKVARLIVFFSIMILSGRSVDDVYVIRMAALCWRLGHLCGSVSALPPLFLLAPLADEARHSLPRTWCARTRRCCEFPPPPVSQMPSSKGKNNNKHFSVICATTYTWKLTRFWQLQTLLCLSVWEQSRDGELHFVFWRSKWRSPEGITLKHFYDVCCLSSVRVFHSWSVGYRKMIYPQNHVWGTEMIKWRWVVQQLVSDSCWMEIG